MSSEKEEKLVDTALPASTAPAGETFKSHPYKIVVFLIAAATSFYVGSFATAFTPISNALLTALQVPKSKVMLTSSMFMAGNVFVAPFVFPIVRSRGLRNTYVIALCLTAMGGAWRCLYQNEFMWILLGQFFLGCGASLLVNTQMEFCFTWFSTAERPLYLSVVSIANIFGGGFGNTLPLLFVKDTETHLPTLLYQLDTYVQFSLVVLLSLLFVVIFLFWDRPPAGFGNLVGPAPEDPELARLGFARITLYYLGRAGAFPAFRNLLAIYALANSSLVVLGSIVNDVVKGFGFASLFGSLAAFLVIFFGLFSAVTYSLIYMKYKAQGPLVSFLIFGAILSMAGGVFLLQLHWAGCYLASTALFGAFSFPLVPVMMEQMTRKFKRTPAYVTNTVIVLASQLLTLFIQLTASATGVSQDPAVMVSVILIAYLIAMVAARGIDYDVNE